MGKRHRVTILGLGNILFRDEGFGVHFIREFQENYSLPEGVLIVEGGTLGYLLMDIICETEYLIVVDTVKAEDKPGSVYRFHPDAIPSTIRYNVSVHEVEFLDILLKAEMMQESPCTTIIAVVPEDIIGTGMELTETVNAAFPKVEGLVKEEIKKLGIDIKEQPRFTTSLACHP
jgi:hydrogenase maturation protease